VQLKPFI